MNQVKTLLSLMNATVFGFIFLILVSLLRLTPLATVFHFRFTWASAVYLLSFLFSVSLAVVLGWRNRGNRTVFWFIIYASSVALYMLANLLKGASADISTYMFWYPLLDFTGVLIAPIFLVFVLHYTNHQDLLYRPATWLALFGTTFITLPLTNNGTIFSKTSEAVRHSFGYPSDAPAGPGLMYTLLWSTTIAFTGMILLFMYYNQVKTIASKRKQARLFIIAAVAPLALGTIDVGVLPLWDVSLPLEPFFSMFQVALISYAIIRYKLFNIDPTALADTILETVNESVVTINTQKEIEYLNGAAEHLLGVSLKNVRGRRLSSIFGPDIARQLLHTMQPGNTLETQEFELKAPEQTVPISLTTSTILSKDSVEGYILVFRDISKERAIKRDIERQVTERTAQLHSEHARLQAAMDSLDVGLLITFEDGQSISFNTVLPKILGIRQQHNHEHDLTLESLGKRLQLTNFDLLAAIGAHKPFTVKEVAYGKKILSIFGAPIRLGSGGIIGMVVLIDDITEAKIVERSKDEFFSIASHELRTPLTSIKGNASMILSYYQEALKDKDLQEMVDDIHESSIRLIGIVNDFLDVSRLEQGKMSFAYEAVSLEEVIEGVVYEMQAVLKEKKLYLKTDKLTLDKLPKVWADKNRLKQVIYNLVGNAAKFTEHGGIQLTAEASGSNVKVYVSDTGRGIPAESQMLLFHKFQQAGNSLLTRDTSRGTGLGLYISKIIVESMGGKVWLEKSEQGKGTTFGFSVPIADPDRQAETAAPQAQTDVSTGLTTSKTG